jgi:hypothetical protein
VRADQDAVPLGSPLTTIVRAGDHLDRAVESLVVPTRSGQSGDDALRGRQCPGGRT